MTGNLRFYGKPPYNVAVVHGGPGAAGEMAPVARELGKVWGVLEPLQTATTLNGQVEELGAILREQASRPAAVIGYSWGAWLGCFVAARYPEQVQNLILVASGPFERRYADGILRRRLERLEGTERSELEALAKALRGPRPLDNKSLARFGALTSNADSFDPLPHASGPMECAAEIFQGVWESAAQMRARGELLESVKGIRCPVVAIHGDHDPHPPEGVREPLSGALDDFEFVLLKNCGHTPWLERQASDAFFKTLGHLLSEAHGS
ncbi:MAG: alpha/beta hydrolase [Elusimicrobia bacterium]|nr:alpha/beta hydrolase [Elusimicrobiota bacterium]